MRNALLTHAAWVISRPFLIGLTGLTGLGILYLFRLDLPQKLSDRELAALGRFAEQVPSVAAARLPAAFAVILCVVLAYLLLRRWHSHRVAIMTAALFACSGWMLHTGRSATPLILYTLVPLALFLAGSWLATAKHSARALIAITALYAVLLPIPGALWFELVAAALLWNVWRRHLKVVKPWVVTVASIIGFAGMAAVALRLWHFPATVSRWLGAHHGLPDPLTFLNQWVHSITFIAHGPEAPDLWLGHAPLLDALAMGALLLGILIYARHWRNLRVRMLAGFGLVASLLIGLSGTTGVNYLLPILYLIAGTGLTQLLHEWYVIFPRNPVARWVGTSMVAAVVALACSYHLNGYFVAWHNAPATKQVFQREL